MLFFTDYRGMTIRFSEERIRHIEEHFEMKHFEEHVRETLLHPQTVIQSNRDREASLYYRYYLGTRIGDKWLCIVVKVMVAESGPHAAVRQGVTSRSASMMVPVAVSMLKLPLRSEAVKVPIASKVVTVSALAELRPTTNKVMTSNKGSVAAPSQYVVLM